MPPHRTYRVLTTAPDRHHVISSDGTDVITWNTETAARHCASLLGHTPPETVPVHRAVITPASRETVGRALKIDRERVTRTV